MCLSFEEANLASFIGISLYLLFSQLCHNKAYLILENKSMFKYNLCCINLAQFRIYDITE